MAKPPNHFLAGIRRLYSQQSLSRSNPSTPIFRNLCSNPSSIHPPFPKVPLDSRLNEVLCKPSSPNALFSRILSPKPFNSRRFTSVASFRLPPLPSRSFSAKSFDAKMNLVEKPLTAVKEALLRYREAVGLQMEAFWSRNYLILVGAGAATLCIVLWRIMFGVASTFVGLSEGMAKYGFLALATAMVAFSGMYLRSRITINPDKVYRIAMRKLNTNAGILEVMGAPLSGTDLRAYIMSGGGPKLKQFKLRFGGKRCFLIFPIRGSERRGLVSVEVKKKKGQYDMKLLAVDIPMANGPDQRLFLIGNEEEYRIGGGLISELRDPIVKAMAAEKEFEVLDEKEEEEDEARELAEAERKQREEERRVEEAEKKQREVENLEKGTT
ncbi:putative tim21 IMS domain superfamily protein [Dioscorea sansibarensis]